MQEEMAKLLAKGKKDDTGSSDHTSAIELEVRFHTLLRGSLRSQSQGLL